MAKRAAAKRELINTGTDKRYVRRDQSAKFNPPQEDRGFARGERVDVQLTLSIAVGKSVR